MNRLLQIEQGLSLKFAGSFDAIVLNFVALKFVRGLAG
jgi:hypothetical protein